MKSWIAVALLTFVCFFQKGACVIVSWANPFIATANGVATLTSTINNKVTTVTGIMITAVSDDASGATAYTKFSQSPSGENEVDFAIASGNGYITLIIASGTTNFATTPFYTFVLTAIDASGVAGTATVTLSVNDNPAFDSQQYSLLIADESPAGTTLGTFTATKSSGTGTFTYAITSGNTNTEWAIDSSTGIITTANALSASKLGGNMLVITASDGTLTGTSTVWITVASCSGATAVTAGCITLLMTLLAHFINC